MSLCPISGIHKEDKQRIKQLLKHFMPDFFFTPRGELSDDEGDKDDGEDINQYNLMITIFF